MIDLFLIGRENSRQVEKWVEGLDEAIVTIRPDDVPDRAVWTGKPFIIAGDHKELDTWFNSLDECSTTVLKDHAFFWVLTAGRRYDHHLLPAGRVVVLDWKKQEQHIVREALAWLVRFSRLAGLSNSMQHLREEIVRIASGPTGPSTPTLILGESGVGKEGTAHSLVDVGDHRLKSGIEALSGAWLRIDPGLAMTEVFGIDESVATSVHARPGLIELYSEGALFVDDFDTAPVLVQEQLLRITATPKGQRARFRRVGGLVWRETNIWLIFATNANIERMLNDGQLRPDFLFRFEDRVLLIPPLRKRPADLPAIAHRIWAQSHDDAGDPSQHRVLPWRSLRDLHARNLQWEGNVRELAALLGLVTSMGRMLKHRRHSTGALMEQILARGVGYKQWFGILASPFYTAAPEPPVPERIRQILTMDSGLAAEGLSPCEAEIQAALDHKKWSELDQLAAQHFRMDANQLRKVFCRYLVFARRFETITIEDAQPLGHVKNTQARKHLHWLSKRRTFLDESPTGLRSNSKRVYRPGRYFERTEKV